ncbi:MAG TPA: hypothetical protein VFX02_13285 [Gammaproteobacteria bacterium]|nr:hypothetical protein [Gammaproteobacteria bacterium]
MLWRILPLVCIVWGCQNTGSQQAGANPARIVIGFDETVSSPDPALLIRLGDALGCELQLIRPIGGNAYVYNCQTADDEASLTSKLDGLSQHKGVRYAEMNRKRKIQN